MEFIFSSMLNGVIYKTVSKECMYWKAKGRQLRLPAQCAFPPFSEKSTSPFLWEASQQMICKSVKVPVTGNFLSSGS